MATKNQKLTLAKNEGKKHLKPYCEEAKAAAEHKAYLALMDEIDEKKKAAEELEQKLAEAHPKCITQGFVIGFLSK